MTVSAPTSWKRRVRPGWRASSPGCGAGGRQGRGSHTQAAGTISRPQPWLGAVPRAADRLGLGSQAGGRKSGRCSRDQTPPLQSPPIPSVALEDLEPKGLPRRQEKLQFVEGGWCRAWTRAPQAPQGAVPGHHCARPGRPDPPSSCRQPQRRQPSRACIPRPPSPFMASEPLAFAGQ